MYNNNNITVALLLGFPGLRYFKIVVFCILLMVYSATVCGNILIIILISYSKNLHTPMYFFLAQITVSDITLSTCITPNALKVIISDGATIPFIGCLIQFYLFFALETLDCYLLTVMAYDRYLAIGNPLYYHSIMTSRLCLILIILCWFLALVPPTYVIDKIWKANFCGFNIIDHFFCDFDPIIQLICSDTSQIQVEARFFSVPVVMCPFVVIAISYAYIVVTIVRIPSVSGRQKAISTCSSHLSVVVIFYGTLLAMYAFPSLESSTTRKVFSMFYTVLVPLLNAVIYSLRNRDIKIAYVKLRSHFYGTCTRKFF
ncbi:olfactory receptor 9G19-like [Lithobates pipiens]